MRKLRDDWVSETGGSTAEFDTRVGWYSAKGPGYSGGVNAIGNKPARFAKLQWELKELNSQWQALNGGPSPVANPIRAGETWQERFDSRLGVATLAIQRIESLLTQLADRGEQARQTFNAAELPGELSDAVTIYNAAMKEAYAIYNRGLVSWQSLERLNRAPTLGHVGLQRLSEVDRSELTSAGDRISATGNSLDGTITRLEWTGHIGTGLTLVTGVGVVYKAVVEKIGTEASKRVVIYITTKKVVGGLILGAGVGYAANAAADAANIPPTARRLTALGIDVVQLILLHRRASTALKDNSADSLPGTSNAKPVTSGAATESAEELAKKQLANSPDSPKPKTNGNANSASDALDDKITATALVKREFATMAAAFNKAKELAGIPGSQQPVKQWTIRGPFSEYRSGAGVRHPSNTHHGRIYEYEIVASGGEKQYRYLVVHDNDPTHGGIGHVHVAESKFGPTHRLQPGERYRNIDTGEPISFAAR